MRADPTPAPLRSAPFVFRADPTPLRPGPALSRPDAFPIRPAPAPGPVTLPRPPWTASPWIDFPSHGDRRGGLVVAEGAALPFEVRRVYWLHHLPGTPRGGHAHRRLWQVMVPLAGAMTVRLSGADGCVEHRLDDATRGLLIGPMTWRDMDEIEPGTACMVMASMPYDEADYIRDRPTFDAALAA